MMNRYCQLWRDPDLRWKIPKATFGLVSVAFESVIQSGMDSRTYGTRKRSGNGVLSVENRNSDGQVEPRIEEGEVRDAGRVESGLEQANEQPYRDQGTWKQSS